MAYEVLARKWRPQQFADVVGQEHVVRTLTNAIQSGRIAHAYLFVGPRGTGKTSTARIFAKALNCKQGPTATPCDQCDSCREIMSGSSLDVVEFDAASNTQVDKIRELIIESVQYKPASGKYKIYIVDEVHMLSPSSFNALLKTLEEPPDYIKFLFATTDPQKLPSTIISRCQRFDLRRIAVKEIVQRLKEIAAAEKIKVSDDALLAIARGAEGGLRDAESALDQLVSFRGREISEDDVLSVFGLAARAALEDLAGAILAGDVPRAVARVAELDRAGKDFQRLVGELLEYFRNVLIGAYAGGQLPELDLTDAQAGVLREQARAADPGRILRVVDILTETENQMRFSLSRRTVLEVGLVRCARAATVVTLDEILQRLEALRTDGAQVNAAPAAPPAMPASELLAAAVEPAAAPVVGSGGDEVALLSERWHEIAEKVGRLAAMMKGYLLDAKPLKMTGNHLTIGFDPEFAGDKEQAKHPRNLKAVQKVLAEVLGREVTVEFTVMDNKSTLPGDIKLDDAHQSPLKKNSGQPAPAKTKQEWLKNPAVRKTLELFNGEIVDVRE